MPLFPWRYNNGFYGNTQAMPYMNQQYLNGGFNTAYNNTAFNEMVKRNIEAENEIKKEKNDISEKKKAEICCKIGEFAGNERNSFLFYEYLRGICHDKKCRGILKKISYDCEYSKDIYLSIYKNLSGEDFFIRNSNIDESVNFIEGILWAIEEESNSVFEISEALIKVKEEREKLICVLHKKSGRIGFLNYILWKTGDYGKPYNL